MAVRSRSFSFPEEVLWACQRCSKCCGDTPERERHILLLPSETEQIREAVKFPLRKFCRKTGLEPFTFEMKKNASGKCVFLNGEQCQVYPLRPLVCRFYPFWLEKNEDGSFSFKMTPECTGIGSGQALDEVFYMSLFKLANSKLNAT